MLELLWKILQAVESEVKQCEKSKKLIMTLRTTQLVTLVFKSLERKSDTLEWKHVVFFYGRGN